MEMEMEIMGIGLIWYMDARKSWNEDDTYDVAQGNRIEMEMEMRMGMEL